MLSSINTIADIKTLYARLGERDYEAVMSYLADDIVWIVADNSPLADRSPYHGIAEVRSGIFERLTAGFDKLVFDADEIFECNGGEKVVALGYYYFRFHGQVEERRAQVAHVWTIRDGPGHQIPAIPRHTPGRTRRGSGLRAQTLLPFRNSPFSDALL
jgi:ketosteroid isomerase-like protein